MKRISMLCCTILALLLLSFMPNVYAEEVEERKQETVPISENTTDYIVKVYDGEEEVAHMQLPEETDLQEYFDFLIQEREILGKTFVGFKEILEDETYSESEILLFKENIDAILSTLDKLSLIYQSSINNIVIIL